MTHRNLNVHDWSPVAVDSVLEHGDLADWRELFVAAHRHPEVAETVRHVALAHDLGGASVLALALLPQDDGPSTIEPQSS